MSIASGFPRGRSFLRRHWPAFLLLGLAALQARALSRVPLTAFGADGAEYIPQLQRVYADRYLEQHGLTALLQPWETLRYLDGHYPALLHVVAATFDRLGTGIDGGFIRASWLCFAALALVGWASGRVLGAAEGVAAGGVGGAAEGVAAGGAGGAAEGVAAGGGGGAAEGVAAGGAGGAAREGFAGVRDREAAMAWAMALTLLVPGLFAAARRYYYDLPMTAAILLAAVCVVEGRGLASIRRAIAAGVLTAAALLIKWAAGLYLAPVWLLGFALTGRSGEGTPKVARARAWLNGLLALGLAGGLVAPVASRPGGSFAFEWRLGWTAGAVSEAASSLASGRGSSLFSRLVSGLSFYAEAAWSAGLGPGFCVAVGLGALLAATTLEGRRVLGWAALAVLPVVGYLSVRVVARDGRYLIPLLPWAALVIAAGARAAARRGWWAWTGALALVALVQVAWVDLPAAGWDAGVALVSSRLREAGQSGAGSGARGRTGERPGEPGPDGFPPGDGPAGRGWRGPGEQGQEGNGPAGRGWTEPGEQGQEGNGPVERGRARAAGRAPRDGWRSWWWSGARRDVASSPAFEAFARAAVALGPEGRVMVLSEPPGSSWIHAWQFYLAVLGPPHASLVAPPDGSDLDRFLVALGEQVDVVAVCGAAGAPDRLGGLIAATAGVAGDPGEVGRRFRTRFPTYRALAEGGLEVHLYGREAGEGR